MSSRQKSSKAVLNRSPLTLALAAALLLPAGFAFAQDVPQEEESAAAQQDAATNEPSASTLEKVTVTGSRIARDTFNSVSPVQVINREETTVAGFNSTAGVLQSNTVTGGSSQINNAFGGYVTNGGPGANTLSLRGLGPTRTLLLLNGRRVSPAGSRGSVGSADLNVLPNIMIDHIEILKDGASSIYGSDAVAGVVNIITKNRVDGVTVEFQRNTTADGGADETRGSIVGGKTGDRWRVAGSLEIFQRSEMTLGQRGWASDCPTPMFGRNPDGSWGAGDYIDPATGEPACWTLDDAGVTINTLGTAAMLGVPGLGGPLEPFNRWRPNPNVTDGFAGFEGVGYYDRDTFDPEMLRESLISPTKNYTGFLQAGFDLHALGDAELYFEGLVHRRESSQNGYLQHTVDYPVNSPLLGDLAWLPAFLLAPADGSTNGQNVSARAFTGWGLYKSWQNVDFFRATTGIRGNLGSEWNYDVSASYARSDADYFTENRLTDRIARSFDVVSDGAGGFVCRDASGGCVAAPVLSADVIAGRLPQAYRDWIMVDTHGNTLYTEGTISAGVTGPLFDLPYGSANGAFGVEYRDQEIDDSPDINSINTNLYGFSSSTPTRGKDSVTEAYAEVELPLLSGLTGAEELVVNLSARYTDYDSYGDDTTWKIGMLYTPVNWLSLRASRGTSYRAPALFEQFLGATSGFLASNNDPCDSYGEMQPTSNTYQNCSSLGLPPDFTQTSSVRVFTEGGAETGLAAETSMAVTAGIVIQPEFPTWFGDLSFAADWFDIEVDNGVARLGAATLLDLCYGSEPADFGAGAGWCNLIQRDANNGLTVTQGYVNIAQQYVRGWDFTARYVRDIGPGSFRANAMLSNYTLQATRTFPDDPLRNFSGTIASPQYTGQLELSYLVNSWLFRYGVDWVGETNDYDYYEEYFDTDYRDTYLLETDDYFLSNASVQYRGDDWSATVGVRNIADKVPPVVSAGWGNRVGNAPLYSGYDYYGRTMFFNVSKSF